MNKKFTFIIAVLLGVMSVTYAQTIKGDFDAPWVKDTKGNGALPGMYLRPGIQPQGWEASNVHQKVLISVQETLVTPDDDCFGKSDGFSVKMENKSVGAVGITSPAPGYITLGIPWVFAVASLDQCDGGTVGGIEFTERPDSLVGFYKRTLAESSKPEDALILAYLWKGTCVSTVPVNPTGGFSSKETTEVKDQDICILGKKSPDSGNAQLIGKAEYVVTGELKDWSRISVPVEYENGNMQTPEKANIIISACNYWTRSNIGSGNALWADDVKFIYNTKLKSVTLGGEMLENFDEDVFEYYLPYADKDKDLNACPYGATATVKVEETGDSEAIVKTVIVTCNETAGKKQLTYTFTFRGEEATITNPTEEPSFTYGDNIDNLGFISNSPAPFVYSSDNESVIKYDEQSGSLVAVGVGTAKITASQRGTSSYSSAKSKPLVVTVNKAKLLVSVKDAWCERGISVSDTYLKSGNCGYTIVYEGFKNGEDETVLSAPVKVTSKASEEPEVVGAIRSVSLSGAEATNYDISYVPNQTLIITKTTLSVYVEYAGKSLNTKYNYKEIIAPVGLDKCPLRVSFMGFQYGDNVTSVFGENLPIANWSITKDDPIGTEGTVSLSIPEMEYENYVVKNCIPDDGKVIVKTAPKLEIAETELDVVYGKEPVTLTIAIDEGTKVSYKNNDYDIASASSGKVTFKQAGETSIFAYISPKEDFSGIEKEIKVKIAKAPLTVKAKDVNLIIGSDAPEIFELEYDGLVNNDDKEKAFTVLPTAILENELPSSVKVGDIFNIIMVPGESSKYNVNYVNGILTIVENTSVEKLNMNQGICIYTTERNLYIKGNTGKLPVSIYNMQGLLVVKYDGDRDVIPLELVEDAVYVVKVGAYVTRILIK